MLQVNSLSVSYDSRVVLKDLTFSVEAGEILGVIGPNGAGKTTLIRALSGVVVPSMGEVRVGGTPLERLKPGERARRVAVVPQARSLPPAFTGWELVLLGRTPHLNWLGHVSRCDEERVRQALERARALDLAPRRLGELSGGEQQRLLLARALAQEAPLLLLDEPTTHLDLQYQFSLLDQVRDLARSEKLAVVIAIHDLNLVSRYADRVALLVEGELRALGRPADVLQPELLGQVYNLPLQVLHNTASGRPVIFPKFL
ncbi:MAG: ABC transporter ATP-binding protein [Chloroflexi bacterium]|nr:MAG: ABC transporter ATP-binding protein [Chloroflexota bacterium]